MALHDALCCHDHCCLRGWAVFDAKESFEEGLCFYTSGRVHIEVRRFHGPCHGRSCSAMSEKVSGLNHGGLAAGLRHRLYDAHLQACGPLVRGAG